MRRDLNTCSGQSAMHHGVRVRVFFRRSSEHHSRNDSSSSSSISWSHDVRTYMFFLIFVLVTFLRVLYNNIHHVNQRSKLHTYSAEVPVLHIPPVEVRFSMTCRFVHGQGKRGNVHIPAIMSSVAFPDVVVFDGFI